MGAAAWRTSAALPGGAAGLAQCQCVSLQLVCPKASPSCCAQWQPSVPSRQQPRLPYSCRKYYLLCTLYCIVVLPQVAHMRCHLSMALTSAGSFRLPGCVAALQVANSTLEPVASGTINMFSVYYPGPGFTGRDGPWLEVNHLRRRTHVDAGAAGTALRCNQHPY